MTEKVMVTEEASLSLRSDYSTEIDFSSFVMTVFQRQIKIIPLILIKVIEMVQLNRKKKEEQPDPNSESKLKGVFTFCGEYGKLSKYDFHKLNECPTAT